MVSTKVIKSFSCTESKSTATNWHYSAHHLLIVVIIKVFLFGFSSQATLRLTHCLWLASQIKSISVPVAVTIQQQPKYTKWARLWEDRPLIVNC